MENRFRTKLLKEIIMKTRLSSTWRVYNITLIVILLIALTISCTPTPTSPPPPPPTDTPQPSAPVPDTPAAVSSTPETSGSTKAMAEDIASEVGKVIQVAEGGSTPAVIVFEEVHDSRAGQIEIAIMMNRLYERYGLRQIGLEGYLKDDKPLDTNWFPRKQCAFHVGQPITPCEGIVVKLLEEGEMNSSEMMLLTYDDLVVAPIEVSADYYQPIDEAWSAPTIYLYKIALPGLSDEEVNTANGLIDEDKILEAVEFIISTDEWADEKYKLLDVTDKIVSIEEEMQVLDEIKAKADEVDAEITDEDQQGMGELYKFYEARSNASQTMMDNVLALRSLSPDAPIAVVVGAAHTKRVVELLEKQDVSFAVISGQSLAGNKHAGDLGTATYDRKTGQLSVDEAGMLGALLDGRIKPKPVINQQWFQSKTQIFIIADTLARAVASGGEPPFDNVDLPETDAVTINWSSIKVKDDDVIFSVQALQGDDDTGKEKKKVTIWVRAHADKEAVDEFLEKQVKLEQRLLAGLEKVEQSEEPEVSNEAEQQDKDNQQDTSSPKLQAISSETIIAVSPDQAVIEQTDI